MTGPVQPRARGCTGYVSILWFGIHYQGDSDNVLTRAERQNDVVLWLIARLGGEGKSEFLLAVVTLVLLEHTVCPICLLVSSACLRIHDRSDMKRPELGALLAKRGRDAFRELHGVENLNNAVLVGPCLDHTACLRVQRATPDVHGHRVFGRAPHVIANEHLSPLIRVAAFRMGIGSELLDVGEVNGAVPDKFICPVAHGGFEHRWHYILDIVMDEGCHFS